MRLDARSPETLFVRVVEAGSFKAAALQLGTDPSAVSRRIAALEQRVGARLLRRSTTGSRPTEAGQRYYEGLVELVAQQQALEASLSGAGEAPQGRLSVTASPEFGVRFVVPVLEQLQHRYPSLAVELALVTGFVNLGRHDIDVAVRIGMLRDSALIARPLGRVPRVVVGSPQYLAREGSPQHVSDLSRFRFVSYLTRAGVIVLELGEHSIELRPHFVVNSISTLVRLACEGKGLCYGPLWSFAPALESGALVRVLDDHPARSSPVQALYPSRRFVPAKTRAFVQAMFERVRSEPCLESVG